MRQYHANFANFVCRFGVEKVLLDYAEEIVIPAFSDETLVRKYGDYTTYFIKNFKISEVDEQDGPILVLSGRFIKNTFMKRDQIYDPKIGIVKDRQVMPTAPSAFFVLILNNHRLVYFAETGGAPDISAFEVTIKQFIQKKYEEFINNNFKLAKEGGVKVTKKALRIEHAPPTVNVMPLTNEASVEEFLKNFSKLKRIEFQLIAPNHEIDGHAIWGQLREYNERLDPDRTTVRTEREEGFDLSEAKSQISDASSAGNQRVKLTGLDANNNRITGDNERFRVSVQIDNLPNTEEGLISRLYNAFKDLLNAGVLKVDSPIGSVREKVSKIRTML